MKSRSSGDHVLHVKPNKVQTVPLTSENFKDSQFDHYIVARMPNVSFRISNIKDPYYRLSFLCTKLDTRTSD